MINRLTYRIFTHLLISVLCLIFSSNLHAQFVPDTILLQELEINSKSGIDGSVIKEKQIDSLIKRELHHLSLAELLGVHSEIYVKTQGKGGLSTASIRGAGASHTKVLWNGFSINSPMLGQLDLSLVPTSFVDDISFSAGGNSLVNTGGALGGSINLVNRPLRNNSPLFEFEQVFGSYQTYATSAGLNLKNGNFESSARFNFQNSENNFWYRNNGIIPNEWMQQQQAGFRNVGFTQQFSYVPRQYHFISLISWNQWNKRDIPPIMTNVQKGGDQDENQQDFFSRNVINWTYNKGATFFELKSAVFLEDQKYNLLTTTGDETAEIVTLINSKNKSNALFIKASLEQEFNNGFTLTAGSDLGLNTVQSTNYKGMKERRLSLAYAMIEKELFHRLTINFLLRLEIADKEVLPLMPLFGFAYQLFKNKELYISGSIARNYNLPTLNDLYWYPGGNPDLIAENGIEVEGSLNYSVQFKNNTSIAFNLTGYSSWINDWIQWTPSDYRYWTPENIAEVYARGLECSTEVSGRMNAFSYQVMANYSLTKTTVESAVAKVEGFAGTQLIYIPVHTASLVAFANYKGFTLNWTTSYIGQRTTTLDKEKNYANTLPAYILSNASLGRIFTFNRFGFELRFKVNNILGTEYQAVLWRPMPGRNYDLILTFNFK